MKNLSKLQVNQIIRFIRARHCGYIAEAVHLQKLLKKTLGMQFSSILRRHGDPDANNYENYWPVLNLWWAEDAKLQL